MGMPIGNIVERLINIKDKGRGRLTREEIEALNDACNILDKCFLKFDTKCEVVDNTIVTVHWKRADIKSCLVENGYCDYEANVDKVLEDKELLKDIESACIEAGWGPIHSRIYDIGKQGFISDDGQ